MATIHANSLEGYLDRSYGFWDSIPVPPKPVSPPSVAFISVPTPSSEPTRNSEKKSARREFQEMVDREREGRIYRNVFPYAVASAMGSAYLLRSRRDLSTSIADSLPSPRTVRVPAPPYFFPRKRVVPRPEGLRIYGTPVVRKLHEEMRQARYVS